MNRRIAKQIVQSWQNKGLSLGDMLFRYFTYPSKTVDGRQYLALTRDGLMIQAEIWKLDERQAMLDAAQSAANA